MNQFGWYDWLGHIEIAPLNFQENLVICFIVLEGFLLIATLFGIISLIFKKKED
jgi:hypothetical protein